MQRCVKEGSEMSSYGGLSSYLVRKEKSVEDESCQVRLSK